MFLLSFFSFTEETVENRFREDRCSERASAHQTQVIHFTEQSEAPPPVQAPPPHPVSDSSHQRVQVLRLLQVRLLLLLGTETHRASLPVILSRSGG